MADGGKDAMIAEFAGVTGVDEERAQFFLESSGWQLHIALSSFYENEVDDSPPPPQESRSTRSKIATMAGFNKPEEDSDSDEDQGQAFYAGGSDTSGQQILGPPRSKKKNTAHDIAQDIFEQARRHGAEEVIESGSSQRQAAPSFAGAGYRLGDTEGEPSQQVNAQQPKQNEDREVVLKFWSNGFTVDDGDLRLFDDPQNKEFLDSVKKGEIPRELHRLSRGGEVHVNIEDHRTEEYTPPKKKKIIAFTGKGQKLGSPAPAVNFNDEKKEPSENAAAVTYDDSKPSTSIQIRLADGTRLVSKFNHDQTVGDIRSFITASRPQTQGVSFALMTTFPNKELSSDQQTIQEANLLNAVIVQRLR